MNDNRQPWMDPVSLWADLSKPIMNFWQSSAVTWQEVFAAYAGRDRMMGGVGDGLAGAWNALLSGAVTPEALHELGNAASFSEVAVDAARSMLDGSLRFQERMKSLGKQREEGQDLNSMKAQHEVFQAWIEFHEREIQPLLKIPQVGLTRFYQEKMNRLFDRFNLYQAAVTEFQYLLCRPMETSLREMREKLDPGGETDSTADFKEYYSMWIKTLEGHYMELFKSPEWHKALSRVVDESASFRVSRNEILMDFMQFLPVPTNKEMDEVYKELYVLKKMVKEMAKKANQQESNVQ